MSNFMMIVALLIAVCSIIINVYLLVYRRAKTGRKYLIVVQIFVGAYVTAVLMLDVLDYTSMRDVSGYLLLLALILSLAANLGEGIIDI